MQKLIDFYDRNYKKLLIFPVVLLVLAIVQIAVQTAVTGDFVNKGVSLKGGSTITILEKASATEIQLFLLSKFPGGDITVRSIESEGEQIGITIESDAQNDEQIQKILAALESKMEFKEYTAEVTGSAIGSSFFRQTFTAMLIAFALMAVVVLIYFRKLIPSAAVILAALSDIIITLAIFNLTGIKLSTAGIAAFLMLIGYSVDTDILLTTRLMKKKEGSIIERLVGAIKTGMTMTLTTLAAVVIALLVTNSEIVRQIMLILLIGLLVDVINTWIQNAGIIRLYLERKHAKSP